MFLKDGCIRFHRAEFLDVFVNHLPSDMAHFRKRVVSYAQNVSGGQIHLRFSDDTIATCDVLVGCDGIKSLVRAQMLRQMAENGHPEFLDFIDPVFSGTIAYRGLIPVEEAPKDHQGHLHKTVQFPMMVRRIVIHLTLYLTVNNAI